MSIAQKKLFTAFFQFLIYVKYNSVKIYLNKERAPGCKLQINFRKIG